MRILPILLCLSLLSVGIGQAQDIEEQIRSKEEKIVDLQSKIEDLATQADSLKLLRDLADIKALALPYFNEDAQIAEYSAMILAYNEEREQADWVAHKISTDIIGGAHSRSNDFRVDPSIATGTAVKADYWYSGYDRGHLAPSADFRWSKKALSESYFYSNMSPQLPEFNREAWADLENVLRRYVDEKQRPLYVVTGPYFAQEEVKTIGENRVAIPSHYYKAVLDYTGDTISGMAFFMPHQKCEYPIFSYALSIDSLEQITGIDFFHALPDEIETLTESRFDIEKWEFAAGNRSVLPIHRNELPEGTVNTVQARSYYDQKATVCGTVASVHKSEKGHVFLNFDGQFPDQLFWCTIWKTDIKNFSYDPEAFLLDKEICVTGIVKKKYGKPSMSLSNEKNIEMFDEKIQK